MSIRSRNNDPLYDAIETTTIRIGRFGYGLLRLPLSLLPSQSRTHMERALYELSHGFASLPGDFARIAEHEIKRWIDETPPARRRQPEPEQHLTVIITPEEAVVEPAPSQHLAVTIAPVEARTETAAPAAEQSQPTTDEEPIEEDVAELLTDEVSESIIDIERLVAEPPNVSITYIEYDPPGSDLEGEFVVISNASHEPVDLTGWTLIDEGAKHSYTFPAFVLAGGAEVTLWTKAGVNDANNLYWGSHRPIWNNTGDTAILRDANGNLISRYTYAAGA
ncbi:lamin tail domain-containing protein [uncultured Chloroflexus sp.]|uniref:lamin tail domain-containing protein n=1 Tax=uncultured Chloroflexus sp. TaxID=214040 RepID=UPI00262EE909|nr:lamin tail domain-containing protein [uncultured Chloroflexus sp.]